jgi:WD40 repeat protein
MAATAVLSVAASVAIATSALWQRAEAEARRAEASRLVTLGNVALGEERTRALAYAIASLERADTLEGRKLALRALWAGPPMTILPHTYLDVDPCPWGLAFAPDGRHLAVGYGWEASGHGRVFPRGGGPPVRLTGFEGKGGLYQLAFPPDGRRLLAGVGPEIAIWETERWQTERVLSVPGATGAGGYFEPSGESVLTLGWQEIDDTSPGPQRFRCFLHRWPLRGGPPELIGEMTLTEPPGLDVSRGVIAVARGNRVELQRIDSFGKETGRVVARYPDSVGPFGVAAFDPARDRFVLADSSGQLSLWPLDGDGTRPEGRIEGPQRFFRAAFSPDGSFLAQTGRDEAAWLWDLDGPSGTHPLRLGRNGFQLNNIAFGPDGRWIATAGFGHGAALWPLTLPYCRILRGHPGGIRYLAFSPDGSRLFTQGVNDGMVLSWDLSGGPAVDPVVVFQTSPEDGWGLSVDPHGRFIICSFGSQVWKVLLGSGGPSRLEGFPVPMAAVDPAGRLAASSAVLSADRSHIVVVLDLDTGQRWEIEPPGEGHVSGWRFDARGRLLVARGGIVSRWDPTTKEAEILARDTGVMPSGGVWGGASAVLPVGDGRRLFLSDADGEVLILDLETGSRTPLPARPQGWVTFDAAGSVLISGSKVGEISVGPIFTEEPHLLLGHEPGGYIHPSVSPDGRWIASISESDNVVRLWPMPDLSKPPLHTLPYEELMARLTALTNLRAMPDEESHTGYSIEPDFTAYHGWENVPTW